MTCPACGSDDVNTFFRDATDPGHDVCNACGHDQPSEGTA